MFGRCRFFLPCPPLCRLAQRCVMLAGCRRDQNFAAICSAIHGLADVSRGGRLRRVSCTESQGTTRFASALQSCATMTCAKKKRIRTRSYGKVEFCLPTKLHAPSLADRLIGRKGCALNAFGLFAPESQATLEAKRSDLGVYDSRFGEPEHRITVRLTEEHVAQVEADRGKKWLLSGNRKSTEKAFCAIPELSESNEAQERPIRALMNNSFGFGGTKCALVLKLPSLGGTLEGSSPRSGPGAVPAPGVELRSWQWSCA
jgi:hypothetical protein